jgi:type VI secretion system protein ImpM
MFWRKKKVPASPPQIGCFGKLPATGDFIRLNASTDELAALDRWMGGAIDFARRALGPTWEQAYPPAVGLFVFRGEAKGDGDPPRGMVGAWASSGDSAGRQYPMIVFGSYDYTQLVATGAALPLAVFPLLAAAYDLVVSGRQLPVDAFLERVARIAAPSLEDPESAGAGYRAWLTTQSMRALWETGFGTDAHRFAVMQHLVDAVDPFRGQELPRTGLAMRVPLGAGDAYAVAVWLDMTLRLTGWSRTLINAFWTPQQTALLHLGPPHLASFRELIAPTGISEHVAELCGVPGVDPETARRRLGPVREMLVNDVDQSIASFLEKLA